MLLADGNEVIAEVTTIGSRLPPLWVYLVLGAALGLAIAKLARL